MIAVKIALGVFGLTVVGALVMVMFARVVRWLEWRSVRRATRRQRVDL